MRRILGSLVAIGAILSSMSAACAFEEPEGFKEAKFGDSEQAVRAKLNIPPPTYFPAFVLRGQVITPARTFDVSCHSYGTDEAWLGDRSCSSRAERIGDIPVKVIYTFRADKLVRISLTFSPRAYPQMKLAFLSRFGKPSDVKESVVKTGMGVEYLNETLTWVGPTVKISLFKYLSNVTESDAHYELLSDSATAELLRREQGMKAADDLK